MYVHIMILHTRNNWEEVYSSWNYKSWNTRLSLDMSVLEGTRRDFNVVALLFKSGINILRCERCTVPSWRPSDPRVIRSPTSVNVSGTSTLGFTNNILTEPGTLMFLAQLEIRAKYFKTYMYWSYCQNFIHYYLLNIQDTISVTLFSNLCPRQ